MQMLTLDDLEDKPAKPGAESSPADGTRQEKNDHEAPGMDQPSKDETLTSEDLVRVDKTGQPLGEEAGVSFENFVFISEDFDAGEAEAKA